MTEHGDDVRVTMQGLLPECRRVTVALSMQASVVALIELTRYVPEVSCDLDRLEADGSFEITARWTPMA